VGTAQFTSTPVDLKATRKRQTWHKQVTEIWNVTSLTGKEYELIEKATRYSLVIVDISLTKRRGSNTVVIFDAWNSSTLALNQKVFPDRCGDTCKPSAGKLCL